MNKIHNFRELNIWKDSIVFVKNIYILTKSISQMNRCAVSIPSSIAEGSGRTTDKEFTGFLDIAISSSYELDTQLILAKEVLKS